MEAADFSDFSIFIENVLGGKEVFWQPRVQMGLMQGLENQDEL